MKKFNGRRVGTLTAGLILILYGIVFLIRVAVPNFNWAFILSLWPLVFILLGVEILISYFINREEIMKYDAGAICLIILLSFFAMGMAGLEYAMTHMTQIRMLLW